MIAIKNKAKGNTIGLYLRKKVHKQMSAWMLMIALLLSASALAAQGISLHMKGALLAEVFASIEKQSDYTFFYNDQLLDKARKVDLTVENASMEDALKAALASFHLVYEIKG